MKLQGVTSILTKQKFSLDREKATQAEIYSALSQFNELIAEYKLDNKNIIDFFIDGIGIEVKIKGNKKDIYQQCCRYCEFDQIKVLILLTNRSIGFPNAINNKPCIVINLGKAWL